MSIREVCAFLGRGAPELIDGSCTAMNVSLSEELIESISALRSLFPDWRMGQLVANLVTAAGRTDAGDIWEIEDEKLLLAARRLIERNRGRATEAAP
jgi:hypothetical protein